MKKVITLSLLFIVLGSIVMSGCQKPAAEQPACTTTLSGLAGTYRLTALKYKVNAHAAEQDFLQYLDACERDDLIRLNDNGTYVHEDAGTSCSPSGNENGSWSLNGNVLTSDDYMNGIISSYDCRTLVFYIDNMIVAGDRYIFTMVKQ